MGLSMMTVESSEKVVNAENIPFRWLAYHVAEIFFLQLPKKIDIDGSGKIQITCGPCGSSPQYEQMLGTSNYYIEKFDFKDYFQLAGNSRDIYLLNCLEKALLDVAGINHRKRNVFKEIKLAAERTRQLDFSMKLHVQKLSKFSPCRRFKLTPYRCLNRKIGEGWKLQINVKGSEEFATVWMTCGANYQNKIDFFKKSEWSDNSLVVRNRLNKIVYKISFAELEKLF